MYKLIKIEASSGVFQGICNTETNSYIPMDEANSDYQTYLKWVADGGVVLPADEVSPLPAEETL